MSAKKAILISSLIILTAYTYGNATAGWYTIDKPGATKTCPLSIDGGNIVGIYFDNTGCGVLSDCPRGDVNSFLYDGTNWNKIDVPEWTYCRDSCHDKILSKGVVEAISGNNIIGNYTWCWINGCSNEGDFIIHGLLYNGTWTEFDAPGSLGTYLNDISGSNIIGLSCSESDCYSFFHNGSWTSINMPGSTWTDLIAIDGNNILGIYADDSGVYHYFLYNGTNWITLHILGYLTGVSGNNIIGCYQLQRDHYYYDHGLLYYKEKLYNTFYAPGAGGFRPPLGTYPQDIDGCTIIGYYYVGADIHGFIYTFPEITIVDDVNPGNCVSPGNEITYTISYSNSNQPYHEDINDVSIIYYLTDYAEFISASGDWTYDSSSRTVTWNIGTLLPGGGGSVTVKVQVKSCANRCDAIIKRNKCELISGDQILIDDYIYTPLCCTCIVIDDFERYDSTDDMDVVWKTSIFPSESSGSCSETSYDSTGASISLNAETVFYDHNNKRTMVYDYNNNSPTANLFSEIRMESGSTGVDWTVGDSKVLSFSYRGLATNSADPIYDRMYVAIIDAAGVMGPVVYNPDPCAQKNTTWKEWNVNLSALSGGVVDLTHEVNLIIGFGVRCNPKKAFDGTPGGTGRVWFDNIRLCPELVLEKTASFEGNCVGPGNEINYTICYSYLCDINCQDINDVSISDYLPNEVDFISASDGGKYDSDSRTVTWDIGTVKPNEPICVTVMVEVKKCIEPGSIITNHCELSGDCISPIYAEETTPVCCCPMLLKVDNITDCINPDEDVNYSICYAANGYGDKNVVLTDFLPLEVNYVSSDHGGTYHLDTRTVTWDIDFPADACGCVNLVVQVKHNATQGGTIINYCQMTGDCIYINESEATPVCPFWCPIYVDANAAGYNDGSSWENAYNYLQDALNYARRCDCNDIRVAQGIYRPDQNSIYTDGTGDRTSTFHLISGVSIYGGFPPGGGEWEDRKPSVYDTNLSGDLLGNDREVNESRDLVTGPCRADNSYHVVSASDVNAATILDGFVITGGNAYGGTSDTNSGGGIYNSSGSPTVRNCTFIQNSAQYAGGGIYNTGDMGNPGEPNIINCVFVENEALLGGGIYTGSGPSPSPGATMAVTNCTFVGNSADSGGGMYNSAYSVLRVTNCILWGNVVEQISGGEVTYSDIEGGWTGEGNINKCPMFEADGYHLTMCSPCVDAGDPNGDYEGQVDIDSEPRLIGPYVDMGADEYYSEDYNIVKFAHCPRPKPSCGAMGALYVGESLDINLTWHPGIFAANVNGHDVYFGTSFSDVNEANEDNPKGVYKGHQSSTTYTAGNLLLCQMYFWRIDEINDACEPYLWKGPVRLFTTGLFIDDFERYTSSADFGLVWTTSVFSEGESGFCSEITYNSTGASIDLDICSGTMIYDYNNRSGDAFIGASALFSEARMESKISGVDWTIGNSNILSISYRGLATNSADNDTDPNYDRMYVAIIDAAGTMGRIVCNNDVNAQKQTTWQEWQIPFSDLKGTTSLDLTKEVNLIIGFGQRCNPRWMDISYLGYGNPGGTGRVWFDNIRLLQPNCNPTLYGLTSSGLISDFTGDSKVNMDDLEIMTQEWLHCGQADIYPDGIVDFCDFAVLAQQWLDEP